MAIKLNVYAAITVGSKLGLGLFMGLMRGLDSFAGLKKFIIV